MAPCLSVFITEQPPPNRPPQDSNGAIACKQPVDHVDTISILSTEYQEPRAKSFAHTQPHLRPSFALQPPTPKPKPMSTLPFSSSPSPREPPSAECTPARRFPSHNPIQPSHHLGTSSLPQPSRFRPHPPPPARVIRAPQTPRASRLDHPFHPVPSPSAQKPKAKDTTPRTGTRTRTTPSLRISQCPPSTRASNPLLSVAAPGVPRRPIMRRSAREDEREGRLY
ncbi:uncharacterized protein CC84DRAFT_981491 [Paraphaeosphaeria sporulosa]|uniref:Uncharacterized protein n=1 Tax=Paraphaeosphaeria sporulosa TaxID=1460663 RepID=A0A177C341_9PLEO|nr:uncharacterized protein CC84DRAFT_981491 [Paraphaeosphaeria sporulosa]OAG02033.1 hypothetical protein CC84DRAFT_981491 [Paraphaeosphaeria sporulosa]